jgi:hypothetical protein
MLLIIPKHQGEKKEKISSAFPSSQHGLECDRWGKAPFAPGDRQSKKMEDPLQLALHFLREEFQNQTKAVDVHRGAISGTFLCPGTQELEAHDSF